MKENAFQRTCLTVGLSNAAYMHSYVGCLNSIWVNI